MHRIKLTITLPLALAATLALTACGGSKSTTTTAASTGESLSGQSITLYNGQHEQTTARLVAAFEKQTGVKVNVRSGDEAELGNQIMQEGSNSPADVFYTENTPALGTPARAESAGAHRRLDARGGPGSLQLRAGRLGGRLRTRVGARLQHPADLAVQPAKLDPGTRRTAVEGQARLRPLGDRLPAADHLDHQVRRRAAAEKWLKG